MRSPSHNNKLDKNSTVDTLWIVTGPGVDGSFPFSDSPARVTEDDVDEVETAIISDRPDAIALVIGK